MSKLLSQLLQAREPLFQIAIRDLEKATGHPSTDVRLTAEIVGRVHMKMRELGLDPRDTTGRELYQALINLVAKHDEFLARRLGGSDPAEVEAMLSHIKTAVEHLNVPKTAWVLKHSVAKRLLKATPPKKVMKQLGYRSIDSMLKREPVGEIYGALRFAESPEWLDAFIRKYKKLQPTDFENRPIEVIRLDAKRWNDVTEPFVRQKRHNITHLKELGILLMLPMPIERMRGVTITVLPLMLHYVNEIRMYSAFFKLQQVRPDFGDILVETLTEDPAHHAVVAGQHIHWRVIQRYFASVDQAHHPEIFEPHVQPEDLAWRKAEAVLYHLEPALHFWHDLEYVGLNMPDGPISFNLMDVAVNYVNSLSYEQRTVYHFREALWNEIYARYIGHKTLEHQVLKQLGQETLEPSNFGLSLEGIV
jgi:hypothetical protein